MTSLEKALGRLFIIGFPGTEPDRELRGILRECGPGGIILFKRNVESAAQVRRLTGTLQSANPHGPLLISIDQEGGRVWRLPEPFTRFPPLARIGRAGSERIARAAARVMAAELAAVGIHCNFSPVLDLNTNPDNPVIGDRSLGTDPVEVARLARAILRGFREQGVLGCGKHFPGHGDTDLDSHLELPTVPHDLERLSSREWEPYRLLIQDPRSRLDLVMTAHLLVPCLDPRRPATLSRAVLTRILRERLGYRGAIVTDDLEMGAITRHYEPQEAALLALEAGADLLLCCHTPSLLPRCLEALRRALRRGAISERRVRQALIRTERLRRRVFRGFPAVNRREVEFARIGCPEHRAVAEAVLAFAPPGPSDVRPALA